MERYNAFISYRHSPHDIKIAAEIQKQLERFHIPSAIRKSTGVKKLSRIFRDKEELSLTGDLNETIQNALDHSDFLILICSPAMKESFWVQKEITHFLKTHSKRQILTVIAEGEPADVLPEILTYEEMELPDENGELETVKVPVEPLSCDYRMPLRKARREELPRLAAPIIGCSYDDLRRRQRQYRMRRMGIAFSAAALLLAALSVYFAWSAKQIQKNLDQALINQSEYLASESHNLMAGGDRLSAVLLSLEALPKEEGERPIVPSAINALSQATYAYAVPGNTKINLDYMITPGGRIDDFHADSSDSYLYFLYDSYSLAVWDLEKGQFSYTAQLTTYINQISFTAEGQLLVLSDNVLCCMSPADGSVLWQYAPGAEELYNAYTLTSDGNIVLFNLRHILLLDAKDGALLKQIDLPEEYSDQNIEEVVLSPDGSHLALYFAGFSEQVLIYDLTAGTISPYILDEGYFYHMRFDETNALYLAAADEAFTYFVTEDDSLYSKDKGRLLKLDPAGNLLWQTKIECFYASLFNQFYFADYVADDSVTPALMYCYSNLCCMYNRETGEKLSSVEFLGSIIDAKQSDIGIRCLLSNGDYAICNASSEVVRSTPCFISENTSGRLGANIYVLDATQKNVLLYRDDMWDDSWQECCTLSTSFYGGCDTGILFSAGQFSLSYFDSVTGTILWSTDTEIESSRFVVLGTDGNTAILSMYGKNPAGERKTAICLIDTVSGNQRYVYLDDAPSYDDIVLNQSSVNYLISSYDENFDTHFFLKSIDLTTEEITELEISLADYAPTTFALSPDGKTVLFWDRRGSCALSDNGSFSVLSEPISEDYVSYSRLLTAVWDEKQSVIAVTGQDTVDLYSDSFTLLTQIPAPMNEIGAMEIAEGQLLLICSDMLFCYDLDGNLIAETAIQGTASPFDCSISYTPDGTLALHIDDILNLIDTTFWQSYTTVECCLYYERNQQRIYTVSQLDQHDVIGYYEEYSLQELIQRAQEQLNGLEASEELKTRYGIS